MPRYFAQLDPNDQIIGLIADDPVVVNATSTAKTALGGNLAEWIGQTLPGHISGAWPVGSIFISAVSTNPTILLGFGVWTSFGAGRMLVGHDSGDVDFDTPEEVGGEKTHILTVGEIPSHTHIQNAHSHVQSLPNTQTGGQVSGTRDASTTGSGADSLSTATSVATNQSTGGDTAHNNMPPYIVCHFWKRTA